MANETTPVPPAQAAAAPQLLINVQYVKDFSFENPRAPQSLVQQGKQPEVALNIDVAAQGIAPDTYEVVLTLNASAKIENEPVFVIELDYAAVVTVKNTNQETLPFLIFVETPRLLFPFARSIVADATRDGGFPPLLVNNIDFLDLARRKQEALAASGAVANGGMPPTADA